jgi:glycogen(starch) synthase
VKNKLNILMYGWEFPPNISGGLGVACHAIVNELTKKGINVDIVLPLNLIDKEIEHSPEITINIDNSHPGKLIQHQIKSILHPYMTEKDYEHKFSPIKKKNNTLSHYGENLLEEVYHYANQAASLAAKIPHDIIHAHDWMTILAAIKAKTYSTKPFILHMHSLERDRNSFKNINKQIVEIEKCGIEQSDQVIAVSDYTKKMIMKYYGAPESKIKVVHHGSANLTKNTTTKNLFTKNPFRQKMVLFLGRITWQKGPFYFIDAAKEILETRSDIQFVIAGTGDLLTDMIQQVAEHRIGRYIHFTGFINHDQINQLYELADVYVMPSISEPFGLTCLEALSTGVPVIVSKTSGVSELVQNIITVDCWDIDAIAKNILALLSCPALQKEMSRKGKKEVEQLTWERSVSNIINLYKSLSQDSLGCGRKQQFSANV